MATFEELKTGLETAFDAEGAKGIEATIQINIEDLTNFYVDINDGALSVVELSLIHISEPTRPY